MSAHDVFDAAVAAYAIDALDAGERLEFEAHLSTCDICQLALVEWRRVVGVPPKAAATRRSPFVWLAAAAAMFVIAGLGGNAISLQSQVVALRAAVGSTSLRAETLRAEVVALRRDSARLTQTLGVLSAPDLMRVDMRGQAGAPAAIGRAYLSRARGLVFAANRLPALTASQIYQLWVIPPDSPTPVSVGVFSVDASGTAAISVVLPAAGGAVKAVAVSVEEGPNGSSAGPQGAILLMGSAG